jgi:hypothetical protein
VEITRADNVIGRIRRVKLNATILSSLSFKLNGKLYYKSSLSSMCLLEYLSFNELRGEESFN